MIRDGVGLAVRREDCARCVAYGQHAAIQYRTYQACKATAQKFNGAQPRNIMAQQRLAVCESLGDQKPDDEGEEVETPR